MIPLIQTGAARTLARNLTESYARRLVNASGADISANGAAITIRDFWAEALAIVPRSQWFGGWHLRSAQSVSSGTAVPGVIGPSASIAGTVGFDTDGIDLDDSADVISLGRNSNPFSIMLWYETSNAPDDTRFFDNSGATRLVHRTIAGSYWMILVLTDSTQLGGANFSASGMVNTSSPQWNAVAFGGKAGAQFIQTMHSGARADLASANAPALGSLKLRHSKTGGQTRHALALMFDDTLTSEQVTRLHAAAKGTVLSDISGLP